MRRHGVLGSLADRLEATLHDLNNVRPRPMLKGRTAQEVFHQDGGLLPDRDAFARAVDQREARLRLEAATRQDLDDARRRAVEQLLLDYGLLEYRGNKLPYFAAGTRT